MIPISMCIMGLVLVFIMGFFIFVRSILLSSDKLGRADIYFRACLFLCSLFLTLSMSTGVYVGEPVLNSTASTPEFPVYDFIPAFDGFWVFVPLIICIASLFVLINGWLIVFANAKDD